MPIEICWLIILTSTLQLNENLSLQGTVAVSLNKVKHNLTLLSLLPETRFMLNLRKGKPLDLKIRDMKCEIWGSYSSDCEDCWHVECDAMLNITFKLPHQNLGWIVIKIRGIWWHEVPACLSSEVTDFM
jgi:hypothetical protein